MYSARRSPLQSSPRKQPDVVRTLALPALYSTVKSHLVASRDSNIRSRPPLRRGIKLRGPIFTSTAKTLTRESGCANFDYQKDTAIIFCSEYIYILYRPWVTTMTRYTSLRRGEVRSLMAQPRQRRRWNALVTIFGKSMRPALVSAAGSLITFLMRGLITGEC